MDLEVASHPRERDGGRRTASGVLLGTGRAELRAECRKPEEGPWSCQVVEGWAEPHPVSWKAALAPGALGC